MIGNLVISNMHPILKSVLAAKASAKIEDTQRFIQDVLIEVNTKLWRLEERIDKEYLKTEDFMNFFQRTLMKVTLDQRREKIKLFANIIVNSAMKENADENDGRKYLFEETIDKIDEKLFGFLLKARKRDLDGLGLEAKGWRGTDEELNLLGVDSQAFQFNAEYLLGVGVMVRLPKFELDGETGELRYHEEYFVTQYGKEFVEYVRERG